jgi:carbamoyl-phosphate synthase large subunit
MDNILISCAGGPAAIGAIKSLNQINFKGNIVTIDCDPLAVGRYLSDINYIVPLSTSKNYWDKVLDIIIKEKITLIIPTGDSDIKHFAKHKNKLNKLGVTVFMSDYDSIIKCQDKKLFFDCCYSKFPLPFTSSNYGDLKFPMFAKPEYGSGSRGIKVCNEISDIKTLDKEESIHRSSNYLFQEYLPGQEYTVDVLCDLESNPIIVVPRKRLQIKAGISSKGQIIKNKEIENLCKNLCIYLNLKGPVCIQLKEDSKGRFKFIEVNPRLGGGTYFSTLAGVNFLELMLKIKNKQQFKIPKFKEITILRYYNEIVI